PVDLRRLHAGRSARVLDLTNLVEQTRTPKPSQSTWIVNGVRNRPADGPEPVLLGQPRLPAAASQPSAANASRPAAARTVSTSSASTKAMDKKLVPMSGFDGRVQPNGTRPASTSEDAQVMLRYQELMSKF